MINCFLFVYLIFLLNINANSINQKQNIISTPNPQISSTTQKSTNAPTHTTSSKPNVDSNEVENTDPVIPTIFGVTRLFYCIKDDNCRKIIEFSLAGNYSYNCYELFLPIEYNVVHLNRKYPSYGFLTLNDFEIMETQKYGQYCKKISRFEINDKKEIVSIMGHVFIFDISDSDEEIQWFLLRNFYLKYWFFIFLRVYDESKDEFLFFKAFNNGIYYIGVVTILVKFSRHLKILVVYYLEAIALNDEKPKSIQKKFGKKSD